MPGTRDVRELEPASGQSLVSQIVQSLREPIPQQKAKGFTIHGWGLDALREACAVLANGQKPTNAFLAGTRLSVVFFSRISSYYVYVQKVERDGNTVKVYFRLVPHRTKELTEHFALIPLEELSPGKVTVEIIRSPMEKEFIGFKLPDAEVESRIVSQSFHFVIEEPRQ